uniref:Uncharacterized protein n=1 Tax=Caenorhabditis japonica TaxID=281687 RepID=A0A8R1DU39_CAEJA
MHLDGLILDIYIGFIWNIHVPLPWTALCTNGIVGEFAQNLLQGFIIVATPTGLTAVYLLVFQMKAATRHEEKSRLRSVVFQLHYLLGFILDIYISFIWNIHVPLPWTALCTNGIFGEFAQNLLQGFIVVATPTGLTAVYLLVFQMKAATRHVENVAFACGRR